MMTVMVGMMTTMMMMIFFDGGDDNDGGGSPSMRVFSSPPAGASNFLLGVNIGTGECFIFSTLEVLAMYFWELIHRSVLPNGLCGLILFALLQDEVVRLALFSPHCTSDTVKCFCV